MADPTPENPIRTLFEALPTLFLAMLVLVAALVGYWALWPGAPVDTADPAEWTRPQDPVIPLTPLAQRKPQAVDATVRLDRRPVQNCVVKILGQGDVLENAVVAILDGKSGVHLARKQLAATKLPTELTFLDIPTVDIPTDEHWAVLARNDSELRFAYLSRARLRKSTRIGGRRLAALRGQVYNLDVQLKSPHAQPDNPDPTGICAHVPIFLRRPNDPDWRYRRPQPTEDAVWLLVTNEAGRLRLSQLGAGRYVLHAESFQRKGKTPEWLPVLMDQDREVTFTGAAR
ncbi:MAG: hypothetical protein ACYTFN_17095 [Planctomycetota bacterium]